MNNVQFATAIHILTLLAITKASLSSAYIAGSINVDPAIVRKSLLLLHSQGLVETKEGKGGGATLAKPAENIFLSDVYAAVVDTLILGRFNNPNPKCKTGKQMNKHLQKLYKQADAALVDKLRSLTIEDFCKNFK